MTIQHELFEDVQSIDTTGKTKVCVKCGEKKPETSFVRFYGKRQTESVCNKCRAYHNSVVRDLKIKYPQPNEKNFQCPICKKKSFNKGMGACLDHNHETETFRGYICNKCNSALGFFEDNINYIRSALTYLEKHEKNVDTTIDDVL